MVPAASVEPVTASGLTQSDLTSWEAELKAEQARLARYQRRLSAVAATLNRDVRAYNAAAKAASARAATAQLAARQSPSIPTYSGGSSSGGSGSGGSSSGGSQPQPASNSGSSG